jgi:LuxR family maltose regulon positive regulatory protein
LELIAAGLSNQEIADRLYLSVPTVKMYASQLYRKLNVRRRTEAVRRARQVGLLPPS